MIVGFIDLKKEEKIFKLRGDIEKLLRSNWLDYSTSTEFEEQMRKRRDPLSLLNLKNQIEAEIKFRKNNYSA
jgi:hypothetical protein